MRCLLPLLLCCLAAPGQVPPRDPFEALMQDYWKAQSEGRFHDAAARREEAGRLLAQFSADSPLFVGRVQAVAQLYAGAGMSARARAVLEDGLARIPGQQPGRSVLLERLAHMWQQDGNLLKSVAYLEKTVAAQEAEASAATAKGAATTAMVAGISNLDRSALIAGPALRVRVAMGGGLNAYNLQRLATAYEQLGRPSDAAATLAKWKELVRDDEGALANYYESRNQLDEAAAIYRKLAAGSTDAQQAAGPLQSLANLYAREQQYDRAAATLQSAIEGLTASGTKEARQQTLWLQQSLAGMLQQAGKTGAADKVLEQLLSETEATRDPNHLSFLTNYANHLMQTHRAARAEGLLSDYLSSHGDMEPWQRSNILLALSNAAREAGNTERAGEYQRRGMEAQEAAQPNAGGRTLIGPDLQKADRAASQGDPEDAFALALQALDVASRAADRGQVGWIIPQIADRLAGKREYAKAGQLYQRLFEVLETWKDEDLQPLQNAMQSYVRFLIGQEKRWGEVPDAIDRYRSLLITAHGAGTGKVSEALMLAMEFARARVSAAEAIRPAEDFLALQEALSGTTSQPYYTALETVSSVFESTGDQERALALKRQAIGVADAGFAHDRTMRGFARMNAAATLANLGRFDDAERLAMEAVALGQTASPQQPDPFQIQLENIRRRKAAARAR